MTILSRTLSNYIKPGNYFSLLLKYHARTYLPSHMNLNGLRNVKLLHQYCKESLHKRKPKKKAILLFLVGNARYAETVESLRETAHKLFKLMMTQCEVHIGLKIRNSIHFYFFYSRIWGEEMAAKMFSGLRKTLLARTKFLLCSILPLSMVDLQQNTIPDEKLDEALHEYATLKELCSATLHCNHCLKRKIVDKQFPEVDYCRCKGTLNYTDSSCIYDSWEPFLERENTVVWRKKHSQYPNMYCYKVYGKYDDISANSFAEILLNTCNRREWDATALKLNVIGSDIASNTDLIYWKVKFPAFYADRDYVYKRRFRVNEDRKEVVIIGEAIQHEMHPSISGIHRVEDYWAIMVIRADNDFHLPGMSYTLTYFDNPGISLPTTITNFIASKTFPDYLCNMHKAAHELQKKYNSGEDIYLTLPDNIRYRRKIISSVPEKESLSLPEDVITCSSGKESAVDVLKEKLTEFVKRTDYLQDNVKIPVIFRNAVVDLLEAAEIIGPELNKETYLAKKINEFVKKLFSEDQSVLFEKLLKLTEKTVKVLKDCAAKKENSLKVMRELEKRSRYNKDDSSQHILNRFFYTFNQTMKTDRDLRTGKLLHTPLKEDKSHSKKIKSSNVHKKDSDEFCPCCSNQLDKSTLTKSIKDELNIQRCPNCYCNIKNSSPYSNIWYRINPLNESSIDESRDTNKRRVVDSDQFMNNAWYFYPVLSIYKLILWIVNPWSSTGT